jgi:Ca2+-binding RTX toxin-like protein
MRVAGRVTVAVGLALAVCWGAPAGAATTSAAGTPTCGGRPATQVGTAGNDAIRGTSGADVIVGLGGNDTLAGLGGRDRICGGPGSDRLSGGAGDDLLLGGRDWRHVTDEGSTERVGDVLAGGPGDDRMVPGRDRRTADDVILDSISWESASRGVAVDVGAGVATGEGRDRFDAHRAWVVGSDHADRFVGSAGPDHVVSGRGADRVRGRAGADRIVTDPARGVGGADLVFGGPGPDMISSFGGEDVVRGGPGADLIDDFGPAADRLYGGAGPDRIFTQLVDAAGARQVVDGGPGTRDLVDLHTQTINPSGLESTADWDMATGALVFTLDHPVSLSVVHMERADLSAWGTRWTVHGTDGPDLLQASGSRGTWFAGGHGDDIFSGSAYDDTFRGGLGHDWARGMGDGQDTCVSVEVVDGNDCESTS